MRAPHCRPWGLCPSQLVLVTLLLFSVASCSKENGGKSILGPGPEPGDPPPSDAEGYFVSAATGHDDGAGTKAAPFKTIRKAILAAARSGADVFVAKGAYPNAGAGHSLIMETGVSVFGGYDGSTWQRDPARNVTEILGTVNVANLPAVDFFHSDSVTLDGFTIRIPDQTAPGSSSTCIRVTDTSKGVVISNNILIAGRGADGRDGTETSRANMAGKGGNGSGPFSCSGGEAGTSGLGWPGGAGGDGGYFEGESGWSAPGADGYYYGMGGARGTYETPAGKDGGPGIRGMDGEHGKAGGAIGVLDAYGYVPASGTDGWSGNTGGGGGGGGGAHGTGVACGAGGGGGGGGGRGGAGGTAGGGGAGSFGILVTGECTAEVVNNTITTGGGGNGGRAGLGSIGHEGAAGGLGGQLVLFPSGGNGGKGGEGGSGGHGGPGGGGPSIGIVEGRFAQTVRSGNVSTIGLPGAGGRTQAGDEPDAPSGIAAEYRKFQ